MILVLIPTLANSVTTRVYLRFDPYSIPVGRHERPIVLFDYILAHNLLQNLWCMIKYILYCPIVYLFQHCADLFVIGDIKIKVLPASLDILIKTGCAKSCFRSRSQVESNRFMISG